MDHRSLTEIYDDEYAEAYDQRFLLDAWPKHGAEFELGVLESAIQPDGSWLDVGCGTGWFLSRFPGVRRAGLDASPAMVARAQAANPDAQFVVEGSFLDDHPEWQGEWDLVTCMWQPYNYVDTVAQVEQLLENLASWTRPGGTLFIPVVDLEDIRPHTDVPYDMEPDVWGGSIALTSITWTWIEPVTGKVHTHLVAPQAGHFVKVLSTAFRKIEVLRYPPFEDGGVARKAILATRRRDRDDDGAEADVVWHPRPFHPDELARKLEAVAAQRARQFAVEAQEQTQAEMEALVLAHEQAVADEQRKWAENAEAWARLQEHAAAETARAHAAEAEVTRLWTEVARLSAAAQLSGVSTKRLVRASLGRLRPDRRIRRYLDKRRR